MKRLLFFLLSMLAIVQVFGQTAISGYVNFAEPEEWEGKIHLKKLSVEDLTNEGKGKPVAIALIGTDGSFSFHKKYISESNSIYRLSVKKIRKALNDSVKKEVDFILSQKDHIEFKKGEQVFAGFVTTNEAQQEWGKFKKFEANLLGQYVKDEERMSPHKGYIKDSLQILMVKLIGVKQLENKSLLENDIAENKSYYLDLLQELKSSDLDPSLYFFLEKRLAYLVNHDLETQLQESKWINYVLLGVLLLLGTLLVFRERSRSKLTVSTLSKQEKTVTELILEGKSNKEIANELFISVSTVKTHITNIYSKLNVGNRQELLQKTRGTST
ncbi:response regulator transcription factor [Flagellimonas nanhaiensis]|uniref:DNA-binding response regulator n=1 Tax=Flagellimonas nanhaiensis TaxID=2292706 RepID=A0A371JNQ2_9FLAO|nr:response regulator transcription factor [Allomuricauda nanhaiensis]RDY58853.1 DNA-binding response regulator [Allomuricauda nanhaiensis]